MYVLVTRTHRSDDGTFGPLEVISDTGEKKVQLVTCEDDWKDNQPNESCIPAGLYTLKRTVYLKYGYPTYEVTGVPGRSRILIHPGNTHHDTQGCILVGMRFRYFPRAADDTGARNPDTFGIEESKKAFGLFMEAMGNIPSCPIRILWNSDVAP